VSAREITRACVAAVTLIVTALFGLAAVAWATVSAYPLFALVSFIAAAVGVGAVKVQARHGRRAEEAAIRVRFNRALSLWPLQERVHADVTIEGVRLTYTH